MLTENEQKVLDLLEAKKNGEKIVYNNGSGFRSLDFAPCTNATKNCKLAQLIKPLLSIGSVVRI